MPSIPRTQESINRLSEYGVHQVTELRHASLEVVDLRDILSNVDTILVSPRVSTDAQAKTGYSKNVVQQRDCMYWGQQLGTPVESHDIYRGESGRNAEQAYLHAMLQKAKDRGRTALMRWSLPRILRPRLGTDQLNDSDLESIARYGVPILSAMPFNASDRFLKSRMATLIADYKKQRGEQYAQTTYVPEDAAPLILELRNIGKPFHKIAAELNEFQMTTKTGKPWTAKQVSRVYQHLKTLGIENREQLRMYVCSQLVTEGLKRM